jgi:hypothetical protein
MKGQSINPFRKFCQRRYDPLKDFWIIFIEQTSIAISCQPSPFRPSHRRAPWQVLQELKKCGCAPRNHAVIGIVAPQDGIEIADLLLDR